MHSGCNGSFANGQEVVDKVRAMGFAGMFLPVPFELVCLGCGKTFSMEHFEEACPACGMVHGITPCHSHDLTAVQAAGVGY